MYCPTCNKRYDAGAFCASDGTALAAEPTSGLVGQVIAERYRIERLLGEGGMGQVFEARHLNINKRFAIKLLKPEVLGSAQSVQRFRQEAWAASSIGHENIVEIDDFATLPDGSVYLAMEFLDGVTVAERLRDGPPIALEEAVAIIVSVCRGLGAAHEKNIIHRDMKPENIFLARRGNRQVAKILDFGIAKVSGADEPSNLTRTGAIFGTPLYMSPEQARGKTADARSDIYSVGVILYELATGSVPFGGESPVEILSQQIAAQPIPPSQLAPDRKIPPALEAVILRALAKDPDARFASMSELGAELETVAQGLPRFSGAITAPPVSSGLPLATPSSSSQPPSPGAPPAVATPARRDGSGAMRLSRPPADSVAPSAAIGARATEAGETALPPRKRRALPIAIVTALAVAAAGGWALLSRRHAADKPITAVEITPPVDKIADTTAPPAPDKPPEKPPEKPIETAVKQEALREVIVDSLPTGAKILRDGKVLAETPEALQLAGRTQLVLVKEGYVDKSVAVDPGESRKVLVKLEHVKAPPLPKPPRPPTPPVAEQKTPAPVAPPVAARVETPPPRRADDPYEIVSAAPPQRNKPHAPAAPPAPPAPPAPKDPLVERIERQAATAIPGGKRVGPIYGGKAMTRNGRSDWFIQLEGGRCYTFVGEGGDGVDGLFLFLWGPAGRRVTDARVRTPHAQMNYCAPFPGIYHFQAKSALGVGEYKVAIYSR